METLTSCGNCGAIWPCDTARCSSCGSTSRHIRAVAESAIPSVVDAGTLRATSAPKTRWREQYDRVLRGAARLSQAYRSSVQYDDDLHHFFQDCWHLKEWIANDPGFVPSIRQAVEREVNGRPPLVVVGDLATGAKHLIRNATRKTTLGAEVVSMSVTVPIGGGTADIDYVIRLNDGTTRTETQVINDAIAEWAQALLALGLII